MTELDVIKVVIVDDHDGVRAGIRGLLTKADDIQIIGEATNGQEAVKLAREAAPDVMLLDVELPMLRGDEVVRKIREESSPVKVLAVSSYDDRSYIRGMLDNGAQGYITKEEASELLVEAVRRVAGGVDPWLSPRAAHFVSTQPVSKPFQNLRTMTRRELDILGMLARDAGLDEIARINGMAPDRLDVYLQVLMIKYNADNHDRLRKIAKKILADDSRQ